MLKPFVLFLQVAYGKFEALSALFESHRKEPLETTLASF